MIGSIFKLFRILGSDVEPVQISLGLSLGIVAGLSPVVSVQTVSMLLLFLILRVNISVFMVSYALFSLIAYLADPLIAALGGHILNMPELNETFTSMYNNGFWRVLNFNNTVAMGSLVISVVAFIPLLLISNFLVKKYRVGIEKYLKNSKLYQLISKSKLVAKAVSVSERVS